MNEKLTEQIRNCPNLPSLPAVAVQVVELAQNNDADITEIARVISKDPALSSKILKTVNSSFYGRSKNVSTISQALVILGLQSVRTLVLGFSLVTTLSKSKSKAFPHGPFWKRSLIAATAAKIIAARTKVADPEEAFLAALLMDIGVLALDLVFPEKYVEIYTAVTDHAALRDAERAVLETDHAEVAGLLAEQWKLPAMLQMPLANHHTPELVTEPLQRPITELIHLAVRCADVFTHTPAAEAIKDVHERLGASYNVAPADADAMMSDIGKRTVELASLFEIQIGGSQDYDAILKRASDALLNISLQTQQGPAAATAAAPARNLQLATAEATGAFLVEQFNLAREKRSLLSLLLIELDERVYIETFGAAAIEAAGQFVAMVACAAARPEDRAGRHGTTTIALVLGGADRNSASAMGEKIRRAIHARPVPVGRESIRATVSIGIASYVPGSPFRAAEHLIKAAAASLAAAARVKNCVKVFTLPVPPPARAA